MDATGATTFRGTPGEWGIGPMNLEEWRGPPGEIAVYAEVKAGMVMGGKAALRDGRYSVAVASPCGNKGDAMPAVTRANANLITAALNLLIAAQLQEAADTAHLNCQACCGSGVPELCGACFPLQDKARLARRAAIAKALNL